MFEPDFEAAKKERRERIRWFILRALDVARPEGAYIASVLDVVATVYRDTTEREIKRELDYLAERDLVELKIDSTNRWFAKLERYGVDVVEYAIPCEPGIARPKWGS